MACAVACAIWCVVVCCVSEFLSFLCVCFLLLLVFCFSHLGAFDGTFFVPLLSLSLFLSNSWTLNQSCGFSLLRNAGCGDIVSTFFSMYFFYLCPIRIYILSFSSLLSVIVCFCASLVC